MNDGRVAAGRPGHGLRRGLGKALWLLPLALGALAIWTARVMISGEAELMQSDAALDRADPLDAVVHARRAAEAYAPGAPHVGLAYRRLIAIATAAEEHRRRDIALFAWRAVRQADEDTRWLVHTHAALRERAEQQIARLGAVGQHEAQAPDAKVIADELAAMRQEQAPRTGWAAAMALGLAVAAAALAIAVRKVSAAGQIDWQKGRTPLAIAAAGALAWLIGLWRA